MSEPARMLVGRYILRRELGRGAMGVVWLARDELLNRDVAVKQLLLPPGLTGEAKDQATARAMREARIAARLHHSNAIAVFDVVTEDHQPWLVMEYLPSRSLAEVLANGPMAPAEAVRVGARVAAALAAAHNIGIVHRDVKPANILLGDGGTVKITDFGIARAADDVKVTETGLMAGTPAFLAPEVARGLPPGPASDVFSLGATLYAAIEGEPPFGLNENNLALLNRVAAGEYPPPRRAGRLAVVLDGLLANDPKERLSATEATQLLDEAADLLDAPPAQTVETTGPAATAAFGAGAVGVGGAAGATTVPTAAAPRATKLLPTPAFIDTIAASLPSTRGRWEAPAAIVAALVTLAALVGITFSIADREPDRPGVESAWVTGAGPAQVATFVADYFDAIGDDEAREAYENLAPENRPSYDAFEDAWDRYEDVGLAGAPAVAGSGSTFDVTVRLELEVDDDDVVVQQQQQLRVAERDGRLFITDGALPGR